MNDISETLKYNRDNQKSLKEYGMNIITGGKTPAP